jgi:uncharacterized membrane protein (DUF2068 family)
MKKPTSLEEELTASTVEEVINPSGTGKHRKHHRGMMLIAFYKLAAAALFVAVGVGALQLLHRDLSDMLWDLADNLRMNPDGRLLSLLLEKAELLNDTLLRRIGFGLFFYAALYVAEGLGLLYEKVWAEYLTLIATASFLPWEVYEVFHRVSWLKVTLLVVNLLVVYYLLLFVVRARAVEIEST